MIRSVLPKDREDYIRLTKEFYNTDSVESSVPDENFDKTFDEMMRSDTYAQGYVFEYDGKIVGYALTAKTYSNEWGGIVIWLEEIYIQPEYRSKGLGKEFFAYLDKQFMGEVKKLRLEVREDNKRAIKLYRSLGFSKIDYMQMAKKYQ